MRGKDASEERRNGEPGGNGGHFFGVGQQFINANQLEMKVKDGNGGPGQNDVRLGYAMTNINLETLFFVSI